MQNLYFDLFYLFLLENVTIFVSFIQEAFY